jgi:tetratricopeptide (TPR) repeat protein
MVTEQRSKRRGRQPTNSLSDPVGVPLLPDVRLMLKQAELARTVGHLHESEALCRKVLATWPGHPDAIHTLGLIALGRGNLELAYQMVSRACRAASAPANYFSNLAEICRQMKKYEAGEEAARRATELDKSMAGAWNNLGIIQQEAGKLEDSRKSLERALALQPNNPETHNNFANTCRRLGLLEEAEQHWYRALELRPNYPEALSNMVILLTEQGNYPIAEEYGLRAMRLNPRLKDVYVNLAALAAVCHNHLAALGLLDQLLGFAPDQAEAHASRALALRQLDRFEEAKEAAERAITLEPDNPEGHHALGVVLQAMGRVEQAMTSYEKAGELIGGTSERALVSQGRMLMEFGRSDEAREKFERALELFPRSVPAFNNLADMTKFKPGDPRIDQMEAYLADGGYQSRTQRMLMHFTLGKAYLDTGDSDRAFEHLNEGNRMKRQTISYDGAANRRWIRSIPEVFTAELMERLSGKGYPSDMPIFVLGMPRSGTTLIEQILASHSQIHGAGELKYLHRAVLKGGDYPASFTRTPPERLAEIGKDYVDSVSALSHGLPHVVDKMPSNFLYTGLIRLAMPGARIIHSRRDPVDTCLSCYSKIFADEQSFTYNMEELGAYHRAYQDLMDHWRTVLPSSHFIEVDYESMVDNTEEETRRLLEFLGLPWEESCLEFYRTERAVRTASVNQVRQQIYRTSSGRWRKHSKNLKPLLDALGIDSIIAETEPAI